MTNTIKQFILLLIYICGIAPTVKGQITFSNEWKDEDVIIFTQDDKYGLLDYDHSTILKPIYDEIIPYRKFNIYIARKGNQFDYAIKQWKREDVVKEDTWMISDEHYDSLFFTDKLNSLIYRKGNQYGLIVLGFYKTYHRKYDYSIYKLSKKEEEYDTIFIADDNILILRKDNLYGMINNRGKEVPPQFDTPPKVLNVWGGGRRIIIQHQNKFGIVPLIYSEKEMDLPFDEEPIHYKDNFYFAKKDGLWGVINVNARPKKEKDNFRIMVSYDYKELTQLTNNIRHLIGISYNPYDSPYSGNGFAGGVFTTTVGKQLIVNDLYFDAFATEDNERYYTLRPTYNGHLVVQDSIYEYLFNEIDEHNNYALIKVKREGLESGRLYGNYFIRNAASGTSYIKGPIEPYEKNKLRAVITYRKEDDSLVILHAFDEEADSITYDILYSSGTGILYGGSEPGFGFILKSTQLKEDRYKHEFFDYYGTLLYSVKSAYPVTRWESSGYPNYMFSYYGRKVCVYNGTSKKFHRR